MPAGPGRALPLAAMVVALLGAAAVMISPITSWTMALAIFGIALLLPSAAILVVWLLRTLVMVGRRSARRLRRAAPRRGGRRQVRNVMPP